MLRMSAQVVSCLVCRHCVIIAVTDAQIAIKACFHGPAKKVVDRGLACRLAGLQSRVIDDVVQAIQVRFGQAQGQGNGAVRKKLAIRRRQSAACLCQVMGVILESTPDGGGTWTIFR